MNLHHHLRHLLPSILLASTLPCAALDFSSPFTSGMVLQRGAPITVTGHGTPGSELKLSLASQNLSTHVSADGSWTAGFTAMKAGGPFTLTATDGKESAKLEDVLVGDVWVCSGQSNMQMGVAETIGGPETIAAATNVTNIRLLTVPKSGADSPQTEVAAKWQRCGTDSLTKFSAVGWYFASHLHADTGLEDVPLGIIDSSFGGTSIEAWTPQESLADIPKEQISGSMFGLQPGTLFNQMIHPLFSQPIKGVLWYQGEANAGQPALYVKLLRNLMNQWRNGWNQPDLPFLIVQLPAFDGKMGGLDFGWLREAEIRACTDFPHAWSAVTYDTTDGLDLHPKEKEEIGRRLALIAKREVYGLKVNAHGPRMEKSETTGRQLSVTFDQPVRARNGKCPLGFAIAGNDGDYRFATAIVSGNKITLEAEGIPDPKTVRYAWGGLTDANLIGIDGLPACSFRTDTLPPESVMFQPMPAFQKIETPVYQLETGSAGRIASLIIRGKQFLSNEPNGGASVPGGWGYRNLALTTVLGPRRLVLSDNAVSLEVACLPNEMKWTLTSRNTDPVDLHIQLTSDVRIQSEGDTVTLTRDDSIVKVRGIERVEDHKLIAKAAPNASSEIRFSIENP